MISAPLRQIFHTRRAGHNPIRQAHTPPPVIPTKAAVPTLIERPPHPPPRGGTSSNQQEHPPTPIRSLLGFPSAPRTVLTGA